MKFVSLLALIIIILTIFSRASDEKLCQNEEIYISHAAVYTKFSDRLSKEPFPWLIQKFLCIYCYQKLDNQVVNSTCPKDKSGWIWQADDP